MSYRFVASSLTALFLNVQLAQAQEQCVYEASGPTMLSAQDKHPVLGDRIRVLGLQDADFIQRLGESIQVDCAAELGDDIYQTDYTHMLPVIKDMMEDEALNLRPNSALHDDKIIAVAQCGVIRVEYNPDFFEGQDVLFTQSLINLLGIVSSTSYWNGSHRGEYEYHAKDGENHFGIEEHLCIS